MRRLYKELVTCLFWKFRSIAPTEELTETGRVLVWAPQLEAGTAAGGRGSEWRLPAHELSHSCLHFGF